jgi:hypothetical protein
MSHVLRVIGDLLHLLADWWREIAGWLLVLIGLWMFFECYDLIRARRVVEAGSFSIIGIVVFRGGIHLLKVGVAARICREARLGAKPGPAERKAAPRVTPLANRGS